MYRLVLTFFALTIVRSSLMTENENWWSGYKLCHSLCPELCQSLPLNETGKVSQDESVCNMICPEMCRKAGDYVFGGTNGTNGTCYHFEEFGCVPYWTNLPPSSRSNYGMGFGVGYGFFRKNIEADNTFGNLKSFEVLQSDLDPKVPTIIVIQGYWNVDQELNAGQMIKTMIDRLLEKGDYNIFYVTRSSPFSPQLYENSVADTILVGLEIANMIKYLKNKMGLKPEDVHLIGHSLGAHAAGYAGKYTPGLGRITGLDPAKLLFQDRPIEHRLHHTDAHFVDVIHTHTETYGIEQPCGHLDFYPNGGSLQPNCSDSICSHNRAYELFSESINSQCVLKGCGKVKDNTVCAVMGWNAKKPSAISNYDTRYYLNITGTSPYCISE